MFNSLLNKLLCKVIFTGLLTTTLLASPQLIAKGVYQSGPDFIAEVFEPAQPEAGVLWFNDSIRQQAEKILGHRVLGLRVRYHQSGAKTAWILNEIGKEMPITIGVVIDEGKISSVKILAYRESRGGEVRYPAYMAQYQGASLTERYKLNKSIDGITGATLSVWAVNKVAALALYYHSQVVSKPESIK
jgi:Na+-translocating ferredoxin:NAD+ oxidoreductase RnfG subunit